MLALTFLSLVLYSDHVTSLNVACVCTSHASSRLYDNPNSHSSLAGFLYQNECKEHKPALDQSHFYAVVHFHKIAYIHADVGVVRQSCSDSNLNPNDKLTTAEPTATSPSHSTPSVIASQTTQSATGSKKATHIGGSQTRASTTSSHATTPVFGSQTKTASHITKVPTAFPSERCNKIAIFVDVAKDVNVGLWHSPKCPDNLHHDADVLVSAFCGAPSKRQWIQGPHVFSNCNHLASFIPIASFDHTATYQQSAGVLLGCNKHSIHVVTQNCSTGLHITEITPQGRPSLNDFYVIEW